MGPAIFAVTAAVLLAAAYHRGKHVERRQVHRWLRFLHHEVERTSLLRLAAAVHAGQHWDWEEHEEDARIPDREPCGRDLGSPCTREYDDEED